MGACVEDGSREAEDAAAQMEAAAASQLEATWQSKIAPSVALRI
jgi:hypothetical protein